MSIATLQRKELEQVRPLYLYPSAPKSSLTLSLPESFLETLKVILTSESVDENLWCDHSNETSSAELSHGTIYILVLYKMKFWIRL